MATIAPLAYDLPPFWHPLSIAIHLVDSLVIDSDQKQLQLVSNETIIETNHDLSITTSTTASPNPHTNIITTNNTNNMRKRSLSITYHGEYLPEKNEIDQYVNDVFQVFGKIFYSPELSANLKYRKQLESLGFELTGFLRTLFQVYYGNLSAMTKYHDDPHTSLFTKKTMATFNHPRFTSSFSGVEVGLYLTSILGTLLRLAEWDPTFLRETTKKTSTDTTNNNNGSDISVLLSTPNKPNNLMTLDIDNICTLNGVPSTSGGGVNIDLASTIANNFRDKSMDRWSQIAMILAATAASLDDLRKTLAVDGTVSTYSASSSSSSSSSSSFKNKVNSSAVQYSFIESIKLSGSIVAQLLWSRSQTQLFQSLVGDTVTAYLTALDRSRNATDYLNDDTMKQAPKKLLHFGGLWRGRWDAVSSDPAHSSNSDRPSDNPGYSTGTVGEDSSGGLDGVDILSLLCQSQVPLWMHDLSPLAAVIESVALKQFSRHKSSIRVFLEMVLIQKTDKLMLLAKADRNVMGVQLLTLLGYDNQSDKGRNALRKNAFALMRLQKYRYAIAAFLYASPPMLKEACSVACKQLNDPFLALFIARYTEFHQGCSHGHPGGLVLGPCSRSVLSQHILPTITDWLKDRCNTIINTTSSSSSSSSSSGWHGVRLPSFLDNISDRHIDIAMLALVCTLWLQDVRLFQSTLQLCLQYQAFCIGESADRVIYKANLLDSNDKLEVYLNRIYNMTTFCSAIQWLRSLPLHFMSIELLEKVLIEFQNAISSYGTMHESIEVYRVFESHIEQQRQKQGSRPSQPESQCNRSYDKKGSFFPHCRNMCEQWKEWARTAPMAAMSSASTDVDIVDLVESGSTTDGQTQSKETYDEDEDVKNARLRLSQLTAASSSSAGASTDKAASTKKSNSNNNSMNSFSAKDSDVITSSTASGDDTNSTPAPPVKSGLFNLAKPKSSSTAASNSISESTPSALNMFDMPVERPLQRGQTKVTPPPAAVKSALDIFDMPIERPSRVKTEFTSQVATTTTNNNNTTADDKVSTVSNGTSNSTSESNNIETPPIQSQQPPNAWDVFDEPVQRPARIMKRNDAEK